MAGTAVLGEAEVPAVPAAQAGRVHRPRMPEPAAGERADMADMVAPEAAAPVVPGDRAGESIDSPGRWNRYSSTLRSSLEPGGPEATADFPATSKRAGKMLPTAPQVPSALESEPSD
jgi:hypothetical protein